MKIVNVSYVHFPTQTNALDWIEESYFFKGIWEMMAKRNEVHFFEFINLNKTLSHQGVQYHFRNRAKGLLRLPFRTNASIRALKPDVVILHGLLFPLQVILLRMMMGRNVKIVVQHHAEKPFQHVIKRRLQKLAYYCVDAYFFTSKDIAKPWQQAGIIKDMNKVFDIIEIASVFHVDDRVKARQVTHVEGKHSYIWVGNLNHNKDPLLVAQAFTRFIEAGNEAHLYMVFQSNDLLPQLQHWLDTHASVKEYIHLIGKLPHPALQDWYNSVDFIISSSHSEAGGVAVSEAISCGCIPILSNIPSFQMMTQNVCGYLYPVGDADALFSILQKSVTIDKNIERERALQQHLSRLSPNAIATKIHSTLTAITKPKDAFIQQYK